MGRRAYQRFAVSPTSEGIVRVFRDVVVQQASDNELIVVGNEPGVIDATMLIELRAADDPSGHRAVTVRVASSQPFMVDGAVRHRMALQILTPVVVPVGVQTRETAGEQVSWNTEQS